MPGVDEPEGHAVAAVFDDPAAAPSVRLIRSAEDQPGGGGMVLEYGRQVVQAVFGGAERDTEPERR